MACGTLKHSVFGERLGGGETLHHGGDLHDHVVGKRGQLAAVADDLVARHGDAFSGDGPVHDFADALDVVVEIVELASGARVQRRVRSDAGEHAPAGRLFYFVEIGGVQKKLHPGPPYTMAITGETRATARMDSVMRCGCVGCVL